MLYMCLCMIWMFGMVWYGMICDVMYVLYACYEPYEL